MSVAELAADLGVDVGDRHHDLGRVAMGHHEAGVGEHLVEVVEPQQVRRALQPPRPGRRSPLQELERPALVAVGGGQVGVEQPVGVRRHVGERLEVVGLEVERHQVLALLGPGRRAGHERRHPRRELVLHLLQRPRPRRCADRARRPSTAAGTARRPPSAGATARSGSSARRIDSAVDPVRGRPRPISGASIGSSSISGWRRYQSSIWRRWARCLRISSGSTISPMALSVASVSQRARRDARAPRGRSRHRSRRARSAPARSRAARRASRHHAMLGGRRRPLEHAVGGLAVPACSGRSPAAAAGRRRPRAASP